MTSESVNFSGCKVADDWISKKIILGSIGMKDVINQIEVMLPHNNIKSVNVSNNNFTNVSASQLICWLLQNIPDLEELDLSCTGIAFVMDEWYEHFEEFVVKLLRSEKFRKLIATNSGRKMNKSWKEFLKYKYPSEKFYQKIEM